jgi:hypothetical protein
MLKALLPALITSAIVAVWGFYWAKRERQEREARRRH